MHHESIDVLVLARFVAGRADELVALVRAQLLLGGAVYELKVVVRYLEAAVARLVGAEATFANIIDAILVVLPYLVH